MNSNKKLNKTAETTKFWLMKTEPDVFSIDDLKKNKTTLWEGVRNYQARNFMKEMQVGDGVIFYHSSSKPSGVAGLATISKTAIPDPTQFNKKSEYFDPKATQEKPIWFCTEVKFITKFNSFVPLEVIKTDKNLSNMMVIQKGSRLSIQPVSPQDFEYIHQLSVKA